MKAFLTSFLIGTSFFCTGELRAETPPVLAQLLLEFFPGIGTAVRGNEDTYGDSHRHTRQKCPESTTTPFLTHAAKIQQKPAIHPAAERPDALPPLSVYGNALQAPDKVAYPYHDFP
jgi:hypothetical protein